MAGGRLKIGCLGFMAKVNRRIVKSLNKEKKPGFEEGEMGNVR